MIESHNTAQSQLSDNYVLKISTNKILRNLEQLTPINFVIK
jgi:hypothetical protein